MSEKQLSYSDNIIEKVVNNIVDQVPAAIDEICSSNGSVNYMQDPFDAMEPSLKEPRKKRKINKLTISSEVGNTPEVTSEGVSKQPHKENRRVRTADLEKDVMTRLTGTHTPSISRMKDGKDHRKRCRVCKTRKTDLVCFECSVSLCVNGSGMENCWYVYHNCEVLPKIPFDSR
jgi:hypothetical protein